MKTSELQGAQLDYWVARAEGLEVTEVGAASVYVMMPFRERGRCLTQFYPSTNWAQGGPIIERQRISVGLKMPLGSMWRASLYLGRQIDMEYWSAEGKSPLVAAMRCYVASRFGDEVPDA